MIILQNSGTNVAVINKQLLWAMGKIVTSYLDLPPPGKIFHASLTPQHGADWQPVIAITTSKTMHSIGHTKWKRTHGMDGQNSNLMQQISPPDLFKNFDAHSTHVVPVYVKTSARFPMACYSHGFYFYSSNQWEVVTDELCKKTSRRDSRKQSTKGWLSKNGEQKEQETDKTCGE